MKRLFAFKSVPALLALALALSAQSAMACAMCYNSPVDSPLAKGMDWGIFSLLFVIVCVLGTIASFFIYLARKSAAVNNPAPVPDAALPSTQKA
ncbi:MAG TPA: hypothetical protein VFB72_13975 [Verrucomicrobiae bacterium]|nr:hypothetical protein [Verrucomicrobiae bacterium]